MRYQHPTKDRGVALAAALAELAPNPKSADASREGRAMVALERSSASAE
jgi:hypothetical protein